MPCEFVTGAAAQSFGVLGAEHRVTADDGNNDYDVVLFRSWDRHSATPRRAATATPSVS